ncbi:unnamed protein product [Phyllotreta striolata]|uniref:RING-type E3 ubiquitin transferase n=1 Tax=Phyllotreta striolata TaxID=444603 RepID=A0A9N9THZ5_PHYSR|nr:unnamed protein product [Phyllotreta striolata]
MQFYKAKVADILRSNQRDELFIMNLEQQIHSFLNLLNSRNHPALNTSVPMIASIWYYFMTSLARIQTLGEEYTGTIRVTREKRIPTKKLGIIWLAFHVGGEPMLDRFLNYSRKAVSSSQLQNNAKSFLLKCIEILKEEKTTVKRIHNALFYINGKYYNISNRITGIQYVLLREWLQDDTFTGSFKLLGNLSLFYVLLNIVFKLISPNNKYEVVDDTKLNVSSKGCVLCSDNIKSPCCTPCGHVFCWNCIFESLRYQKSCPICREEINRSRIIFLQNFV